MDGHVREYFLKGVQKLDGIAVTIDYPEDNQFPPHLSQSLLHDVAVTGRAGLGTGGGIDDYGIALVVLRVSCRLVHLSVLSRVCRQLDIIY